MFIPRIIPVLLLKGQGLVKTEKFKNPRYLGDPINAVKIFNDLNADELVFLDITASMDGRTISESIVKNIGDEAFMPVGVGGGINTIEQIERLLKCGSEKVIINTKAYLDPLFIEKASKSFGSQSIVVSIDVKKSLFGKYEVWIKDGSMNSKEDPIKYAKRVENCGAGEIFINLIDFDGMMCGYDLILTKSIADAVNIPVVASGGAGNLEHLKAGYFEGNAHALSAGSMFVYHGPRKAVLINYPTKSEIKKVFYKGII